MSIISKASAKNYYLTGNFPTQAQFADTIDSYLGLGEAGSQTVSGAVAFAKTVTVSGKATHSTASFSGKVSADAGLNTTVVSAASINLTGAVAAASVNLTGAVSAASVNVTGDLLAVNGRVTVSAATINNLLTGSTASFSGIVSAGTFNTNNLIINGASIVSAKGSTSVVATVSGAVTSAHMATWDASGNLTDGGTAPTQIMTALGVGAIILASQTSTVAAGGTTAASNLSHPKIYNGSWTNTSDAISGTWQAMQNSTSGDVGLWQRTV